jgi:signal transduction histidine kinase/ligand-binding sensor domain-containing protein/DNA-binding response OmpR family regulator
MSGKAKICLFLLFALGLLMGKPSATILFAQNDIAFKKLTVENGLSNNWVKAIIKDDLGFMWFGTYNGLNRYDGRQFKAFFADSLSGLNDNFIQCLAVDDSGRIWIGTFSGGLNLFDPATEQFTSYLHDPDDPLSISNNRVYSLLSDGQRVWVGTSRGLDVLDSQTGKFERLGSETDEGNSPIPRTAVYSLYRDKEMVVWIGTNEGLIKYQPDRQNATLIVPTSSMNLGESTKHIRAIFEDKYGFLWVGTWGGGLFKMDREGKVLRHFYQGTNASGSLSNNSILDLAGNNENLLFIATEGGGLNVLDLREETVWSHQPDLAEENSINSNSIHKLYYDDLNGIFWTGTYNGGINYFSKWDKHFQLFKAEPGGLNNGHITCAVQDKNDWVWIGTDGGGINVLDTKKGRFSYYNQAAEKNKRPINDAILSLLCDRENNIWVGTYNGGLDLIGKDRRILESFRHDPEDPNTISGRNINAIYEDKRGNIWVGTMFGGLNLFDPVSRKFSHFRHDPADSTSIVDDFIYGIFEDRNGRILVQTGRGLDILDYNSMTFRRFGTSLNTDFGVPLTLFEDSQGNLWIGSQQQGLFRVDRTGVQVKQYIVRDGLPSNNILGILEDNLANLWISTDRGLCRLEEGVVKPERIRFQRYATEDGLQGSEFKRGAYCKLANGKLLFGGQNGFNIFDPLTIRTNPFIPPVEITELKLFNKTVDFRENNLLDKPLSYTSEIDIGYENSVLTFEFAALNYVLASKNEFAYMLEGFENAWNYVGTQNHATYTNLDPGKYIFRVKASNNDGNWNEQGDQLVINVLPPWWKNVFFRVAILLFLVVLVVGYYLFRTYELRKSKKELERQVKLRTTDLEKANSLSEERQNEISRQNETLIQKNVELKRKSEEINRMAAEIRELNEAKLRFFTNISHELRTPLNLIIWPLEDLIKQKDDLDKKLQGKLELMQKNANKLIKLINQVLEFRKIQTRSVDLHLEKKNLLSSIQRTFDSFEEWAKRKEISFTLQAGQADRQLCFDENKLDIILSNLLSNAFKFVDKGGNISVEVIPDKKQNDPSGKLDLMITVEDDGIGIPEDQIDLIFQRYYEGGQSNLKGSGIGLSMVKELVEIQSGTVSVMSQPGKGARFTVIIPVQTECPDSDLNIHSVEGTPEFTTSSAMTETGEGMESDPEVPTLLIVDDNPEIIDFMYEKLRDFYNVMAAQNGEDALKQAVQNPPDLILSDIMMPGMDGFELCEKLKMDERTSHIPIILATAKVGEENVLKGLSHGADDYISKPFSFSTLQLKIKNMLYTRQKLKDQFMKSTLVMPENLKISSTDERFLHTATRAIRENLDNPEFGVDDFSSYFDISRRHVLRKLKAITGMSINEYIRVIRLKESYRLLAAGQLNVSEVAYSVGFTDPKYFSNCFKKQFGHTPSEVGSNPIQ